MRACIQPRAYAWGSNVSETHAQLYALDPGVRERGPADARPSKAIL
jgi:hypothetical protein